MSQHNTVEELLTAWDAGDTIWSIELGGLGPGYEQAIQIAAVEFARACKDLTGIKKGDRKSIATVESKCSERLNAIDNQLGGLTGAQFHAACWLAWQWCFNGGPTALQNRLKAQGIDDRAILISRAWPKAPTPNEPA